MLFNSRLLKLQSECSPTTVPYVVIFYDKFMSRDSRIRGICVMWRKIWNIWSIQERIHHERISELHRTKNDLHDSTRIFCTVNMFVLLIETPLNFLLNLLFSGTWRCRSGRRLPVFRRSLLPPSSRYNIHIYKLPQNINSPF
jgi:hypothetical protein